MVQILKQKKQTNAASGNIPAHELCSETLRVSLPVAELRCLVEGDLCTPPIQANEAHLSFCHNQGDNEKRK